MKKLLGAIFLAAVCFLPLGALGAAKQPFYYSGWLPYWKKQGGALDFALNLDRLQEINPFSYEIRNGAIYDALKITQGFWPDWLSAVHDANVKIVPTVAWFDGDGIQALLSNRKKRIAHEDAIAKLVKDMKFDGIDIDYESKNVETKPYFSLFIEGLASRLHARKKILSCTIQSRTPLTSVYATVPKTVKYADNYAVLNQYCDEVKIMAYDQGNLDIKLDASKGNGDLYAPVADPDWVKKVVQETVKYISRKKIMLGVPTYGYEYEISWSGGATAYRRVRSFTFTQAMDRADSVGAEPRRNSAGELSFTYATSSFVEVPDILKSYVSSTPPSVLASPDPNATTTLLINFSDAQAMRDKINLAKKYGLRGVSFFKIDGDEDPYLWEMLK